MASDPKWEATFWFDYEADYAGLRVMQRFAGPQTVESHKELFIGDHRRRLLETVSLMTLVCGAGKTLLMIATMLHINRVVCEFIGKGPRCGRILWFVKERALAIQLELELNKEIVAFGLHHRKPTVQICDESGDLERGPGHNDITISCPNALWERSNQRRSDEEIARILAQYDTIIWDECDFAISQIKRLVNLSPHALKFGLTASPIDGDGEVLRECFVLAGIASYQQVFDHDRCLKHFVPWEEAIRDGHVRAFSHKAYSELTAGVEALKVGQHFDRHSLPGAWAAVSAAMEDCRRVEQDMRQQWPAHWYSPHILIVCDSRVHADEVVDYINNFLRDYPREFPVTDGWRALAVYDEYRGEQRNEKALLHRDQSLVHPFLRAKTLDGRCDRLCARICVVVDMGIRGMNNWPILFIVDIKRSISVNVQVQTKGRDSRLPTRLLPLTYDPLFPRFCTGKYYFPESGDNVSMMKYAYEFTWNIEERLTDSGLLHWSDLLMGTSVEVESPPQSTIDPLTFADRLQIDAELSHLKEEEIPITPEVIKSVIDQLPGEVLSDARRKHAEDHIKRVTDPVDTKYRRRFVDAPITPPIVPVATETPALDPSLEVLRSFVVGRSRLFRDMAEEILPKLETDSLWLRAIKNEFVADHERHYLPLPKLFQLHRARGRKGILTDIAGRIQSDLLRGHIIDKPLVFGDLMKSVTVATSELTGITDTSNDGLLDHPSYHYVLVLPHNQARIRARAISLLMQWQILERLVPLYADVL